MMGRRNSSPNSIRLGLAVLFVFMLFLNFLTPYVADDYVYMVSFDTKELLTHPSQLIPSMYVHCFAMNGRVVSHGLEQIFMLMPKAVFNVCNSAVFVLLVYLMYRIANHGKEQNPLLLSAIAMGLWCAMPAFGQVMLWQVGALNYLWALAGCLVFLLPYLVRYLTGKEILERKLLGVFCLGSVLFGMYSEIASFVGIYLAAALLLLAKWAKGKDLKTRLWLPLLCACAGYCIMLCMPAELPAKSADELTVALLWRNFLRASAKLAANCWILLLIWVVSFLLGWKNQIGRDRLILSGLMLTGALGANYMTMIASYYPERCLFTTVMLLVLSIGIMLAPLTKTRLVTLGSGLLAAVFAVCLVIGVGDIRSCHQQFTAREAVIAQAKAVGETDLVLEIVEPATQYSPFWDLRDLSTEDPETWPNSSMAKYYGVDSILGKAPEK